MSCELPSRQPGMCSAIVESDRHEDGAKHYSRQRVIVYGHKRCSRKGVGHIGHLDFCTTHARLAREGLIDENGQVASKSEIRDVRNYPTKFPGGLYRWARDLEKKT